MAAGRIVVLAVVAWLAGCATVGGGNTEADEAAARDAGPLQPFSANPSLRAPEGWSPWILHATKRPTRYRSVLLGGERVLEASADSSASGLVHRLGIDPAQRPILSWRWRVDAALAGADVGERHADDSPVRIVLGFEGDKSSLPVKEQMFFERVKLLSGHDMPYATLMYVWDGGRAPESITVNANTSRVRKIIVDGDPSGVRTWRAHRRDIVADYERAYGVKPGRLVAIALMTDTDNTKQTVRSWYGDIQLDARTP
jgi:hypothetical protein